MFKILKPINIGSLENSHHEMQHQNDVNKIRAERLAHTANPLALVDHQQQLYHPLNHIAHYTHNSLTKSQQLATINKGKAIVNSSTPTYDQEPVMVAKDDEILKDKEIDNIIDLISLSFKKIHKPTNNNFRTSLKTIRANQDNTLRINRGTRYDNQMVVNVAGVRENVEKADWRDDTDDEPDDQELEAHNMYMAQIQEVTLDAADNLDPSLMLSHCRRITEILPDVQAPGEINCAYQGDEPDS
uniref:Uncharacterized protein n=1 Tax=Tanacetum cinerariifolium TaxID=118510 RepID=A0A699I5X5_TANCI|nr:hypothetical protein [Tanacetum cinerariifolium]